MAEKLQDKKPKGATVTKLPTRAAAGAGKSKPNPSKVKLKDSVPKAKGPTQAEKDAALRAQLRDKRDVLAHKHRLVDNRIEVVKATLKELMDERKEVRAGIELTGLPLALFDEAYSDARKSRVDLEEKERLRKDARDLFALPSSPAEKPLLDGVPAAAREETYWDAMGYQAGKAGLDNTPPSGCPPERHQAYMKAWERAQTEIIMAMKRVDESADASTQTPPAEARGEDSTDEEDEDPEPAGNLGEQQIADAGGAPGDDFEMSEEERQSQAARRAVQDGRETDAQLEPHGLDAQRQRLNPTEELTESVKRSGPARLSADTATAGGIV
jgi:hypothetical protein